MQISTPLFIMGAIFLVSSSSKAQVYVDGNNINLDSNLRILEVVTDTYPSMFYINTVDVGKGNPYRCKFTDEKGKRKEFKSSVAFLTYMNENGWELKRRDVSFQSKRGSSSPDGVQFLLFERKE